MKVYENDGKKSIDLYENCGFVLNSPLRGGKNLSIHKKAKRGKIKGWSSSSRMRMRSFLADNRFPSSWVSWGLTLTIPGYPITYQEAKRLFKLFQVYSKRLPFPIAAVWRMEVQKRNQLHWHLVIGGDVSHLNVFQIHNTIRDLWLKCLKALGRVEDRYIGTFKHPIELTEQYQQEYINGLLKIYNSTHKIKLKNDDNLKPTYDYWKMINDVLGGYWETEHNYYTGVPEGAHWVESSFYKYAIKSDFFPNQHYSNWIRYLNDHTSKSKQHQIPNSAGKHWGYINKKYFVPAVPKKIEVTDKQFFAVHRWQKRLQTPILKDYDKKGWLFNRRKAKSNFKRSPHGSRVYFGNPLTVQKMIDYAVETIDDTSESIQVVSRKHAF